MTNCNKCGRDLGDWQPGKVWTITIGDRLKTYIVCEDCKNKFIKWMEKR